MNAGERTGFGAPSVSHGSGNKFVTFGGEGENNFAGKPRPMESENRREPPRTQ